MYLVQNGAIKQFYFTFLQMLLQPLTWLALITFNIFEAIFLISIYSI